MNHISIINNAIKSLYLKLNNLNLQELKLSDHIEQYLIKYRSNFPFYMGVYSQLLHKALLKINNPVNECTFIDYGGGCGILSWLAKMTGFKTVIYNDIYEKSLTDAEILSKTLNITIDNFICGDAEDFVNQITRLNIQPDLICSFDVLEHIYNLEDWIKTIAKIQKFHILFMTGVNPKNPFIVKRLKKVHLKSEYLGSEKNIRFNDTYLNTSNLKQRELIISEIFPHLKKDEIEFLSKCSRGLRKDDIEKMVGEYLKNGTVTYKIDHPTNTCDPYTGSWTERLIDLKSLDIFCQSNDFELNIYNSFYCYSNNKALNIAKFIINQLIKILGEKNLFLSPAITVEIKTLMPG